jgi:hypothetical protein
VLHEELNAGLDGERWNRVLPLAAQTQRRPARDEYVGPRAAAEQACDGRAGLEDLLEVVEDEEDAVGGEPLLDRIEQRARPLPADPERLCDGRDDLLGRPCVGQRHEVDAVGVCGRNAFGGGRRQAGLAHAAGGARGAGRSRTRPSAASWRSGSARSRPLSANDPRSTGVTPSVPSRRSAVARETRI